MKPLAKMTAAERQARIAKLVSNPATRSAVPEQYLPAKYRNQRQMNQRLNAPVVDGSTLTNRDVSRQATSAAEVKYGDAQRLGQQAIGQSEQAARDQAGWYDTYLKELAQHQTNIDQIGQGAVAGVKALAGTEQAAAPAGVTLSDQNGKDSGNAAAVRRALLNNIGGVLTAQGANENTYADTLAHVVGPGQKLTAQAQGQAATKKARDDLAGLLKEKGTYRDQVIGDTTASESKNVLANRALGLDITKAATDAAAGRSTRREQRRSNKASETAAANDPSKKKTQAELDYFNKNGYWPPTGPPKPAKGTKGKGPDWVTPGQSSAFQTDFDRAKAYAKQLLANPKVSRAQAAAQLQSTVKAQKQYDTKTGKMKLNPDGTPATTGSWTAVSSAVTSAALDVAQSGHLSAYTVKKLIAAGIKPSSLGVPTAGSIKATRAPKYKGPDVAPGDRGSS